MKRVAYGAARRVRLSPRCRCLLVEYLAGVAKVEKNCKNKNKKFRNKKLTTTKNHQQQALPACWCGHRAVLSIQTGQSATLLSCQRHQTAMRRGSNCISPRLTVVCSRFVLI